MPSGVYIRTEKHLEACRKTGRKVGKLLKTQKQLEASCANGRKVGKLPKTEAQLKAIRTKRGDNIIEHHNDLCHGAERPDDVTLMLHREHSRLHGKLHAKLHNGYIGRNYGLLKGFEQKSKPRLY